MPQNVIDFIRNATNQHYGLRVAELRPGGSSARNTHLGDADADIVVLFKEKPKGFQDAKNELKEKVNEVEKALRSYREDKKLYYELINKSTHVVQCIIDGVEVDVVCAWLLSSDSEWNSLSQKERAYFSASRTHDWTKITRGRRVEVNEVTRLFKCFGKRAFSACGDDVPHPLSCVMEALVLCADDALQAKKEEEKKEKKDDVEPRKRLLRQTLQEALSLCSSQLLPSPIDKDQNLVKTWTSIHFEALREQARLFLVRLECTHWTADTLVSPPPLRSISASSNVCFYLDVAENKKNGANTASDVTTLGKSYFIPQTSSPGAKIVRLTEKLLDDVMSGDITSQQRGRGQDRYLVMVHDGRGEGAYEELTVVAQRKEREKRNEEKKARSPYGKQYNSTHSIRTHILTWDIRQGLPGLLLEGSCPYGCGLYSDSNHMKSHTCPFCQETPVHLNKEHTIYSCKVCDPKGDCGRQCSKTLKDHERLNHTSCSTCGDKYNTQQRKKVLMFERSHERQYLYCCEMLENKKKEDGVCVSCTETDVRKHISDDHVKCEWCEAQLQDRWRWWRHMEEKHAESFQQNYAEYKQRCGNCGDRFKTKGEKKRHKQECSATGV